MLRWIDRWNAGFGDCIAWVYIAVFAITVYDVAARYIFNSPSAWGAEVVIALCGIHYVMSGAMALQRGDHVRIDVIYNLFPLRVRQVGDVLSGLFIIAVLLVLIWFGWRQALPSLNSWERTGTAWNSPTPVFMKLAIPLAGVLMLLQALSNLIRDTRLLFQASPPSSANGSPPDTDPTV